MYNIILLFKFILFKFIILCIRLLLTFNNLIILLKIFNIILYNYF